jgi:hypothetical protein
MRGLRRIILAVLPVACLLLSSSCGGDDAFVGSWKEEGKTRDTPDLVIAKFGDDYKLAFVYVAASSGWMDLERAGDSLRFEVASRPDEHGSPLPGGSITFTVDGERLRVETRLGAEPVTSEYVRLSAETAIPSPR